MKMEGFRTRVKKSGVTYYYFDAGGKPRKEIALGPDYVKAVAHWAELTQRESTIVPTFEALADRFEREHIPALGKRTQQVYRADLKHLRQFFAGAPLAEIKSRHVGMLLDTHKAHPTTANRLKRLFNSMFNLGKRWGYAEGVNPADGIRGLKVVVVKRHVQTDTYSAVWECAGQPLRDAMDLAYLTGQRPADTLKMSELDLIDGTLCVTQNKTEAALRIEVTGEFAALIVRIQARKATHKVWTASLVVNEHGKAFTAQMLRLHFAKAKATAIATHPKQAAEIKKFWFTKLRSKAATDVATARGTTAASELLGHATEATTKAHYIEKTAKSVRPTR